MSNSICAKYPQIIFTQKKNVEECESSKQLDLSHYLYLDPWFVRVQGVERMKINEKHKSAENLMNESEKKLQSLFRNIRPVISIDVGAKDIVCFFW